MKSNVRQGIAVAPETESVAHHEWMTVNDSGNTKFYIDIDVETLFDVDIGHFMVDTWPT